MNADPAFLRLTKNGMHVRRQHKKGGKATRRKFDCIQLFLEQGPRSVPSVVASFSCLPKEKQGKRKGQKNRLFGRLVSEERSLCVTPFFFWLCALSTILEPTIQSIINKNGGCK